MFCELKTFGMIKEEKLLGEKSTIFKTAHAVEYLSSGILVNQALCISETSEILH